MDNLELIKMLPKVRFYNDVVGAKDSIPLRNIALALDLPSEDSLAIIDILEHKKSSTISVSLMRGLSIWGILGV